MLTTWILSLVIGEVKDTSGYSSYIKSYYWAEAWIDLWLLAYNDWSFNEYIVSEENLAEDDNWKSLHYILGEDTPLTYDVDWYTDEVENVSIAPWKYHMVKLKDNNGNKVLDFDLNTDHTTPQDLKWNVIWTNWGITWEWEIDWDNTTWISKSLINDADRNIWYTNKVVKNFLEETTNSENVLILFNSSSNSTIYYSITSADNSFQTAESEIIWSSKPRKTNYKQNLRVKIDNSEWVNFLKYSIYLPNE